MNRLSHIDGLRGFAVVLVLLFHLGIVQVPGGFVGVDVFFVVSGFVITNLIKQQRIEIRLADFYVRRFWRLLPALFVTVGLTLPVAGIWFSPSDFGRLAASAASSLVGLSNVLFWTEAGYFDTAAGLKPLLHTWSLGVEFQFYFFWPALLLWALRRRIGLYFAVGCFAIALPVCVWATSTTPSAAYFLMPFRVWEFAFGAMLTWLPARSLNPACKDTLLLAGLLAIIASATLFNSNTEFPGLAALLPVAGAGSAIASQGGNSVRGLLGNRVIVWLGRVSYSLYLVHWPVVSILEYSGNIPTPIVGKLGVTAAIFLLACALHYAVEKPCRHLGLGRRFRPGPVVIAVLFLFVPLGHAWATGWSWRLPAYLQSAFAVSREDGNAFLVARYAEFERPSDGDGILIIGDSQSQDMLNVLLASRAFQESKIEVFRTQVVCGTVVVPQSDWDWYFYVENERALAEPSQVGQCKVDQSAMLDSSRLGRAKLVILTAYWYDYQIPYIAGTVAAIQRSAPNAQVVVFGRKNNSRYSGPELVRFAKSLDPDILSVVAEARSEPSIARLNSDLRAAALAAGALFLDFKDWLCPTGLRCQVVDGEGIPLLYDQTHLSPSGVSFLAAPISAALRDIMQ